MLPFHRILACLTIFIAPALTLNAQERSADLERDIDSIVLHQQYVDEVPGLAVGILKDGKVIYKKASGWLDVTTRSPLNTRSDFHLASVSKPFTALAIMQLVDAGKAVLDSPLVRYLPSFKMKDPAYRNITLLQMLTHRSGIPDVTNYEWDKPQTDDSAVIRYIGTFAGQSLDFPPGSSFRYSNAAFNLLVAVVAQLSGMTFESYMEKYVFLPAGMTASTFLKPVKPPGGETAPHILGKDLTMTRSAVYPYNRIHAGSSTLHSNVDDMLRWGQVWLNGGTIDGHRLLSPGLTAQMLTPRMPSWKPDSICLSWFMMRIGATPVFFHAGGDLGYRSFFAFVPSEKLALVLMGNNDLFDTNSTAVAILQRIIYNKPVRLQPVPIHFLLKKYILSEGIGKVKEIYYHEKKLNSGKYAFSPGYLDKLGYMLLGAGHPQQAVDIFLFNVELDPSYAGWYDSVGDGYKALGKKELAVQWYKKALTIDPSLKETETKIKELQ